MIVEPMEDKRRAVLRAVLEAGAQFTPLTAALTRLYQTTHPDQFSLALAQWRTDVTETANDHAVRLQALEERFAPRLQLSDDAVALAIWLAQTSEFGLDDPVTDDQILAALPTLTGRGLEDAAAELKAFGLADVSGVLGRAVRIVRPTRSLFALFDPIALGTSPQDDAIVLAEAILALDSGSAPELEAHLGWTTRRLNSALGLVLDFVRPRTVSREVRRGYSPHYFHVGGDERVALRRLIAQSRG